MSDCGWLQSPSPLFVTERYRNSTVSPGVRPDTTVLDWRVLGADTHVLPASVLYCHP
jgi:hypothetical protein